MLSRYRVSAVPVMILFAAHGAVTIVRLARGRDAARIVLAVSLLVVSFPAVNREVVEEDLSVARYNLANRYSELERWDEAIRTYRAAIAENPDYISSFNNLAVAYEKSGRTTDAVGAWRDVLRIARARRLGVYIERARNRIAMLEERAAPLPSGPQRR